MRLDGRHVTDGRYLMMIVRYVNDDCHDEDVRYAGNSLYIGGDRYDETGCHVGDDGRHTNDDRNFVDDRHAGVRHDADDIHDAYVSGDGGNAILHAW